MRIALVTEQFAPDSGPTAQVAREVLDRLLLVARLPGVRLVAVGAGRGAKALGAAGAKVIPQATEVERAQCVASFDVLQPRKTEVWAPVVAYHSGSTAHTVQHEHDGLLVSTDRGGKAFAKAVTRLRNDPELRDSLAAEARASVIIVPGATPSPS